MMTDRFSADLRRHLLATANERPADGQLAAIDELVAVTPQRRPLVTRLPWSHGRINPFPSVALRYGLIAIALIIALVAAALAAGFGPTRRTVFEGTWTSIDVPDGSTQTLIVGPGMDPAVHFEDAYASGAACVADAVKVFKADGVGEIFDDRLDASFPHGGGCGSMTVEIALRLVHDADTDSLRDQDGIRWSRLQASVVPPSSAPVREPSLASQSHSTSAPPTPHPGEATFTSTIHGFSMGVPNGWQTRPATEPWAGEPLGFDSPRADVIFDPTLRDGLYLIVASQPFGGMSEDQWTRGVLEWTCPEGRGEFWGWTVDGAYSSQRGPCNSGSLIATDTRGYLIRLVASSNKPELADAYDWDWLEGVLETVDLRPEDAVDPAGSGTPVPRCADIAPGARYTNRFGTPKLSATVPVEAKSSWQGYRDVFALELGDCRSGEPIRIDTSIVDAVIDDACVPWTRSPVKFGTLAEAAQAIVAQPGHRTSKPTEVTIAGHAALRLEVSTEGTTCTDGIGLWYGNEFGLDRDAIVYLVDMDGDALAIAVWYVRALTTLPELAEAEAIVASIQIEP